MQDTPPTPAAGGRSRLAQNVIPLAFAFSVVGLLILGGLAYYLLETARATDALVLRTAMHLSHLERLHLTIVDAESNGRAYIISGEDRFRDTYSFKIAQIDEQLREFREQTQDDQAEQPLIAQLEQHVHRRFAYLQGLIGVRVERGLDALKTVKIGNGVAEMGAISSVILEMKRRQNRLFDERIQVRAKRNVTLTLTLAAALLFAIAVLGTLFWYMNRLWLLRQQAETKATHLAHHDALTGLPNRRLLEDRLAVGLARARRSQHMLAVLCLDLDGFKAVNDSLGHGAGDELLRAVAARLTAAVRAEDTVARLGGDEFVATLSSVSAPRDAEAVAAKIIAAVSAPYEIDGHAVSIGMSVGIANFPTDGASQTELLERADAALYDAKQHGKGRYVSWRPEADVTPASASSGSASSHSRLQPGLPHS